MCGPSEDPVKRLAIDRTSERVEVADKLLQLEEMAVLDELALSLPVPGPCPSSLDGSFDTICAHAGVCCWQSAKTLGASGLGTAHEDEASRVTPHGHPYSLQIAADGLADCWPDEKKSHARVALLSFLFISLHTTPRVPSIERLQSPLLITFDISHGPAELQGTTLVSVFIVLQSPFRGFLIDPSSPPSGRRNLPRRLGKEGNRLVSFPSLLVSSWYDSTLGPRRDGMTASGRRLDDYYASRDTWADVGFNRFLLLNRTL